MNRPPVARNRCLLYPRKPTFSWPTLTSGCDPTRTFRRVATRFIQTTCHRISFDRTSKIERRIAYIYCVPFERPYLNSSHLTHHHAIEKVNGIGGSPIEVAIRGRLQTHETWGSIQTRIVTHRDLRTFIGAASAAIECEFVWAPRRGAIVVLYKGREVP